MKYFLLLIFALVNAQNFAQNSNYKVSDIPAELLENANAVVRFENIEVSIASQRSITIKQLRVVTVLNEYGITHVQALEARPVKSISATMLDANGKEIKKFRGKDFKERTYSDSDIITDRIVTYLDFTPAVYPFTIIYESVVGDSNTAFIPTWSPINSTYLSIQKAVFSVEFPANVGFKYKEFNLPLDKISKISSGLKVVFSGNLMPAIKYESYSPSISDITPHVLFGLSKFHLEGLDGQAETWEAFSSWNYNNLLVNTDELSSETVEKVKKLVANESDKIQKAKLIYKYVQDKTRYVSIQLGIGGWKPMRAKDVDRLGYGDCKALTNYTRALLKVANVDSYYAIIYGGNDKRDLQPEFVSTQGNHVILAIPNNEDLVWLECTSQTMPFGFIGNFTDDRLALLVKPSGGQLVKTTSYLGDDNSQLSEGSIKIDSNGKLTGTIEIKTQGTQYDNRLQIENKSESEKILHYKKYLKINNCELSNIVLNNNHSVHEFSEKFDVSVNSYAEKMGNRLMFAVNAFNQYSDVPERYRLRKNDVVISRGFYDLDEITILLPEGFKVEALPQQTSIKGKFGEYIAEYTMVGDNKLLYKRKLKIKEGTFFSEEYEDWRKFREIIAKYENAKTVLVKI